MATTTTTRLVPAAASKTVLPDITIKKESVEYDSWIDEPLTDEEKARLALISLEDAVDWC